MPDERTKVVATLGPATDDPAVLERMVDAGLDVVRLNFSHGTHDEHQARLETVRRVRTSRSNPVAVLADLQGPKIRVGKVGDDGVTLTAGDTCELVAGTETAPPPAIPVVYEHLAEDLSEGDRILLDDGSMELTVSAVRGDRITATVRRGGVVHSRKGVNLPGVAVSAPSLTDKDLTDLAFAVDAEVDYVALSFVRRADDVHAARDAMAALGADIPLVTKLERPEALEALEDILAVTDVLMVARGDLGVEVAVERVPTIQKEVIARSSAHAVPTITATQMLESMIGSSRPTRAEASDVANAVFDGSDAVMLSGETAVGRYPVEAVEAMVRITREAEAAPNLRHPSPPPVGALDTAATVCKAAVSAAKDLDARAVVVFTESGSTARMVSRFRPRAPIVAFATTEGTRRRMAMFWGVEAAPCVLSMTTTGQMLKQADTQLVEGSWASEGDLVVVVTGAPGLPGATNRMIVHRVGEPEPGTAG